MAVNKVDYYGKTLIDISDSTVTPETLAEGAVAYNKAGERIVGEMKTSKNANPAGKTFESVMLGRLIRL